MLSSESEANATTSISILRSVGDVIESLARTAADAENHAYRLHAVRILDNLCYHYTKKDDEHLQELMMKRIADVMPKVIYLYLSFRIARELSFLFHRPWQLYGEVIMRLFVTPPIKLNWYDCCRSLKKYFVMQHVKKAMLQHKVTKFRTRHRALTSKKVALHMVMPTNRKMPIPLSRKMVMNTVRASN